MSDSVHVQAYLAAFEASRSDLTEILAQFAELEVRKGRLTKVVDALKPFVETAEETTVPVQEPHHASHEPRDDAADPHYFLIKNPVEPLPQANVQAHNDSLDSIQRRISSALGMAAVA